MTLGLGAARARLMEASQMKWRRRRRPRLERRLDRRLGTVERKLGAQNFC